MNVCSCRRVMTKDIQLEESVRTMYPQTCMWKVWSVYWRVGTFRSCWRFVSTIGISIQPINIEPSGQLQSLVTCTENLIAGRQTILHLTLDFMHNSTGIKSADKKWSLTISLTDHKTADQHYPQEFLWRPPSAMRGMGSMTKAWHHWNCLSNNTKAFVPRGEFDRN